MNPIYKKCLTRIGWFVAYGMLAGWLLTLVEKRDEPYAVTANRLLNELKKEMKNKYNITNSSDFDRFVEKANEASQLMRKFDWTFINGCGFAFAAITTIGYGHITPQKPLGQGLTIVLCIIGLPITMLALKTAGEVLLVSLRNLTITLEKKILRRRKPENSIFKCLLMIIFWITLLMCILATVEKYVNGWTFLEGVYCWFVTLTTIGFGDYLPLQKLYRVQEKNMIWVYAVTGIFSTLPYVMALCLVSSLLNLLVEYSEEFKMQFNTFCCHMECCCCRNHKRELRTLGSTKKEDNNAELQLMNGYEK
ncbi:potassium channel subfamily K member 15-like [Actinia tenebrosa]|uniref:Potassium channel subfamily K member 15-like n=1 Tax=Actinia tenebrosa TaxID=6105 RepID=A0A6P8HM08_ACTTE|nr:potassium channel subfamily K member 15-like [Actinia tenebrosa]